MDSRKIVIEVIHPESETEGEAENFVVEILTRERDITEERIPEETEPQFSFNDVLNEGEGIQSEEMADAGFFDASDDIHQLGSVTSNMDELLDPTQTLDAQMPETCCDDVSIPPSTTTDTTFSDINGELHFSLSLLNLFLKQIAPQKDAQNQSVCDDYFNDNNTKNIIFKCSDCGYVFKNILDLSQNQHMCQNSRKKAQDEKNRTEKSDGYVTLELVSNFSVSEGGLVPSHSPPLAKKLAKTTKKVKKKKAEKSSYKAVSEWLSSKSENEKLKRLIDDLICPECQRRFPKAGSFRRHIECVHIDMKNYTCETCGVKFGRKFNYQRHILVHDKNLVFSCGVCERRFLRYSTMCSHMFSVHSLCSKADDNSESVDSLMENLVDTENHFISNPAQRGGENEQNFHTTKGSQRRSKLAKFECGLCDSFFVSLRNLRNHVRFVHLNERKHKCALCDLRFTKKSFLRDHIRRVHMHLEVPFCKICKTGFAEKEALVQHGNEKHNREDIAAAV